MESDYLRALSSEDGLGKQANKEGRSGVSKSHNGLSTGHFISYGMKARPFLEVGHKSDRNLFYLNVLVKSGRIGYLLMSSISSTYINYNVTLHSQSDSFS